MGTFGDKKPSAFKIRRITKRIATIAIILITLMIVGVFLILQALRSEAIWRKYVFSSFFGPYWETCVEWRTFTPRVWPPGITIEGLTLHEPNEPEKTLLTVEKLEIESTFHTRPDQWDIEKIDVTNINLNLIQYDETTNWEIIKERLFSGKNPTEPPRRRLDEKIDLPQIYINDFSFLGLNVLYKNLSEQNDYEVLYTSRDPVFLTFPYPVTEKTIANLGTEIQSKGNLIFSIEGEKALNVPSELIFVISDLRNYPRSSAAVNFSAYTQDLQKQLLSIGATIPFDRLPVREKAVPFEDVRLILEGVQNDVLLTLTGPEGGASFDPLTGEFQGDVVVDVESPKLFNVLDEVLASERSEELYNKLEEVLSNSFGITINEGFRTSGFIHLKTRGLYQYAAVDENEILPADVQTTGSLIVEALEYTTLSSPYFKDSRLKPAIKSDWDINLSEVQQEVNGHVSLQVFENLATESENVPAFGLKLYGAEGGTSPFQFNPFLEEEDSKLLQETIHNYSMHGEASRLGLMQETVHTLLRRLRFSDTTLEMDVSELGDEFRERMIQSAFRGDVSLEDLKGRVKVYYDSASETISSNVSIKGERLNSDLFTLPYNVSADIQLLSEKNHIFLTDYELSLTNADNGDEVLIANLPRGSMTLQEGPVRPFEISDDVTSASIEISKLHSDSLPFLSAINNNLLHVVSGSEVLREALNDQEMAGTEKNHRSSLRMYIVRSDHVDIMGHLYLPESESRPDAIGASAKELLINVRATEGFENLTLGTILIRSEYTEFGVPEKIIRFDPENAEVSLTRLHDNLVTYQRSTDNPGTQWIDRLEHILQEELNLFGLIQSSMTSGRAYASLNLRNRNFTSISNQTLGKDFPLKEGSMDLVLQGVLSATQGSDVDAVGNLTIDKVGSVSSESSTPKVICDFLITERESSIRVSEATIGVLDPDGNPFVTATLDILFEKGSDALESTIHISFPNLDSFRRLSNYRFLPVISASQLLSRSLPLRTMVTDLSDTGSIDIDMHIGRDAADNRFTLEINERGDQFDLLEGIIPPFTYAIDQNLELKGSELTIKNFEAYLDSPQISESILSVVLQKPVYFSNDNSGGSSSLDLKFSKSVGELPIIIRELAAPYLHQTLVDGELEGVLSIAIPSSFKSALSGTKQAPLIKNSTFFEVQISDLMLESLESRFSGTLSGYFVKEGPIIGFDDLTVTLMDVASKPLEVSGSWYFDNSSERFFGEMAFSDWDRQIISILPYAGMIYEYLQEGTFNLIASYESFPGAGIRSMSFDLAGDNIQFESGFENRQRTELDSKFMLTTSIDEKTSEVLFSDLHFELNRSEGLAPNKRRIASITQKGNLLFSIPQKRFQLTGAPGTRVEGVLSPTEINLFGNLFRSLTGFPIKGGVIDGDFLLEKDGDEDLSSLTAQIQSAEWQPPKKPVELLNLYLKGTSASLHDEFVLEDLSFTIQDYDDLNTSDTITLNTRVDYAEPQIKVESDVYAESVNGERFLAFFTDIVNELNSQSSSENVLVNESIDSSDWTLSNILQRTRISLSGEIAQLNFRDLSFPNINLNASYEEGKYRLKSFAAEVNEGRLEFSGLMDTDELSTPWELSFELFQLDSKPWLTSFFPPAVQQKFKGTISAEGRFASNSTTLEDIQKDLTGSINLTVLDLEVDDKEVRELLPIEHGLDLKVLVDINGGNAQFRAHTPWEPDLDLAFQGILFNFFPTQFNDPWIRAVLRYDRLTTVGPREQELVQGVGWVPIRKKLYGFLVDLYGPLDESRGPSTKLRSAYY